MNSKCRSMLAVVMVAVLTLSPMSAMAQGPCSTFRTWDTGNSFTASDANSSFTTVGVTNMEFS